MSFLKHRRRKPAPPDAHWIEAECERIWNDFLDRNRHHGDYGGAFSVTGGSDEERRRARASIDADEQATRERMRRLRATARESHE